MMQELKPAKNISRLKPKKMQPPNHTHSHNYLPEDFLWYAEVVSFQLSHAVSHISVVTFPVHFEVVTCSNFVFHPLRSIPAARRSLSRVPAKTAVHSVRSDHGPRHCADCLVLLWDCHEAVRRAVVLAEEHCKNKAYEVLVTLYDT